MNPLDKAKQRLQKALENIDDIITDLQREKLELEKQVSDYNHQEKARVANPVLKQKIAEKPIREAKAAAAQPKEVTVNDLKKLVGI